MFGRYKKLDTHTEERELFLSVPGTQSVEQWTKQTEEKILLQIFGWASFGEKIIILSVTSKKFENLTESIQSLLDFH